jgi:hypothetical protein
MLYKNDKINLKNQKGRRHFAIGTQYVQIKPTKKAVAVYCRNW